jgi:hypothetical protein
VIYKKTQKIGWMKASRIKVTDDPLTTRYPRRVNRRTGEHLFEENKFFVPDAPDQKRIILQAHAEKSCVWS